MANTFSLTKSLAELEELEAFFTKAAPDLEQAMQKHARAMEVGAEVLAYLQSAQNSIEQVVVPKAGKASRMESNEIS